MAPSPDTAPSQSPPSPPSSNSTSNSSSQSSPSPPPKSPPSPPPQSPPQSPPPSPQSPPPSPPPQSPPQSPPPSSDSPPPHSPDKDNDNSSSNDNGNNNSSSNSNSNSNSNSDSNSNSNSNSSSNSNSNSKTNSSPPPKSDRSPKSSSSDTPPSPSDQLQFSPPKQPEKSPSRIPSRSNNDSNKTPSSKSDSSSKQDQTAEIIAAVLGGVILIMLIIACVFCLKKKKRKGSNAMQYYADSGAKGNEYYNNAPPPKWHNGAQGMDPKGGKLPPPPGAIMPPPGSWNAPPPPPTITSDVSSAYSGPHGPPLPPPSPTLALGFNKSTFSYDELAAATGGFSPANLLGQGGFGYVYKGFLPNGKEIAVKQLKSGSGQGEREFQAEVDIISRVHHRHLVSLVGYCITGAHRMLVYEFVPNNTLEHHLHGKGLPVMDWPTRLKIALGSAKGLAYLHEDCHPRIIHRDIKAANILLDFKFEAMVADFGLAKLSQDNHTHVSTRIMGTFGYLAPEYASSGKLTEKSDVFSYGVMLLELITGRRPVDSTQMEDSLVDWARPLLSRALADGNYDEIVDPRLESNYNPLEMSRMAACAAASVRHSGRRRPKMSQIVRALEGDVSLEDLNEGVKPGQSMLFSSSSDYDSGSSYTSNMRQFRKVALASTDFSDEYSRPTSDYGLNPSESSSSGERVGAGGQRHKAPRPL